MTFLPLLLSQAHVTVRDVQMLGGMLAALRSAETPPESFPNSFQRLAQKDYARLQNLATRLIRSGFADQAMLFETSDTPALMDLALTATLGLCAALPGAIGDAAVEALTQGARLARPARPQANPIVSHDPAPSHGCMSLEMIRLLIRPPAEAALRADAVRSGKWIGTRRPVFSVAPPGAGFGDWFGQQMYSADAKDVVKFPAKALEEWGRYVDALSEHAEVFVIPYASDRDSSLWRIVYTANGPQILDLGGKLHAVLPNLSHLGRQGEHRWFQDYLLQLGLEPERILQSPFFQEGQADFSRPVPRAGRKPLLFLGYGIRTPTRQPYAEMKRALIGKTGKGEDAVRVNLLRNYEIEMIRMNPNSYAFHQDTWLNLVRNRDGKLYCMYAPTWVHPDDRGRFAKIVRDSRLPVILLSDADAKAYAANANEVDGRIFLVKGGPHEVSPRLKARLQKSGFEPVELEFDELFSKAGGGTRCMVNEIRDIDRNQHREFFARLEFFRYVPGSWERLRSFYPERYEPKEAGRRKKFIR